MRKSFAILCGLMIAVVAFGSIPTTDMAPYAGPIAKVSYVDAQWDILWSYNAQAVCQDNQLLGVEFANNMFWITGGNNAVDPNQMYRLTPTGAIVDSANQPAAATGWGIRDLAYDGSYVYGGCEATTIFAFDPVTGANVPSMNIPRPAGNTCVRALAYDPATDHFWTGNFTSNMMEFDRSGAIIWQGAPPAGVTAIYGMAWDNHNPAAPRLWIFNQSPNPSGPLGCSFFEYNPVTHTVIGSGSTMALLPGSTSQIAGGATFTGAYNPSFFTMIGITQGTPNDMLFVTEMFSQGGGPTLDINTSAVTPPVIIPANGGTFPYNINVHNLTTVPQTFQVWNKVRSGTTFFQVFGPITRALPGGANPTRVLNQTIAGSIPAGTLDFISYIGAYPSTIVDSSSFQITKTAVADGNPWVYESNVYGDVFDEFSTEVAEPMTATTDMAPGVGPVAKGSYVDAQWDILWSYNAQAVCQDNQLLGVEFANNMFWITGGNNAVDPNQMYRLTPTGAIVDSANQPAAATGWGIRDLAYDGSYVYGGCEATTIFAFDPVTGANVPSMNIPRPAGNTCVRALAYDPATDHFWTGNFTSNMMEFDRSGAIIWQGAPPAGVTAIYGMAWDNHNPAAPRLWIFNQSPNPSGPLGCSFFEYNPVTHTVIGSGSTMALLPGSTSQIAGGATFTGAYNPSFFTMIGITQGTPNDMLFVTEMFSQGGGPTLDINTSAVNPPVIIPANGGTFPYNINVHNLTTVPQTFQVWNKVRSGTTFFQVFGPITRALPGGANPTRVLNQTISGSIPAGTLDFISYIGAYPSTIIDSSSFQITKTAIADGNPWIGESYVTGDFFDEYTVSTATPAEFAMISNFPNPFNPNTNISYTLPTSGNVKLSVFDVSGREVANLVNGYRDAGSHSITFDGSNLASGIYMYRLTSGDQVVSGKMVLMK